jgi:hypothetical protein
VVGTPIATNEGIGRFGVVERLAAIEPSAGTGQWHTKARMHKQAYRHRKTPALWSLAVIEGLVRVGRSAFFEG